MDNIYLFTQALCLPEPWFISNVNFNFELKRLDIEIDFKKGSSFEYKDEKDDFESGSYKAYDTKQKTWRHLNFFEHECYITCRTPRVKTSSGKVRSIRPPWAGLNSGFTLLFEALVLQLCQGMPVNSVSKIISVDDEKLWRLLNKYVDIALEKEDYSQMTAVGMDETSKKKNHDYVSLFVDMNEKKIAFVAEGKDNKTVEAFADDLEKHNGDPEKITDVSCDMSPAFIKGVKENLPNAQITFDKFHIMKIINEAVDNVRKSEVKDQESLKGLKYAFLKNRENLSDYHREKVEALEDIKNLNLKTIRAWHIRENFQEIYKETTKSGFESLLKKWYFWATHSKLKPIISAAKTIKNHWDGILRWQKTRISNGILEGLNSILQAAKKKHVVLRLSRTLELLYF